MQKVRSAAVAKSIDANFILTYAHPRYIQVH